MSTGPVRVAVAAVAIVLLACCFVLVAAPLGAALVATSGAPTAPSSPAPPPAPDPGAPAGAGSTDGALTSFARLLLAALHAPVTATNVGAIVAWAAGEGSCAANNPLDTTQPEPGATAFNSLGGGTHVWNYPTTDLGVQATVTTLTNGLYGPVLAALDADAGVAALEQAVRSTPWGTGSFGPPTWSGPRCG